jgi:hypothetical protein
VLRVGGTPFAPGNLSLNWIDIVLVVTGVPIAAVASARLALRRVQISPLGVSRRASSAPPRVVRVIPLLAGIAVLAYFDARGKPGSNGGQLLELLIGFVLLVAGLVLAGPWLTTAGSRLMAKRANRPATLIAGGRLPDNPKAAFRFISGLVIALFVTSAAIGALSSIAAAGTSPEGGNAGKDTATRRSRVDHGRSGLGCALPPLTGRHRVPDPGDRVLGHRGRTRCVTRDHRLGLPAPQPDHRTRGRPKRVSTAKAQVASMGGGRAGL